MAAKLVTCEHCGGRKTCVVSGGRSCRICLEAAGLGRRHFAAVRCSFCGGRGRVWVDDDEEDAPPGKETSPDETPLPDEPVGDDTEPR